MTKPYGKSRRKVRNFVLDSHLQFKFTAYAVAATVVVSALLGAVLWRTSRQLFREMQRSVDARSQAALASHEVGDTALTMKLLARFDDPSFERVLRERSHDIDQQYEAEKSAIVSERAELVRSQMIVTASLVASLIALIFLVGLAGVVATHKIVGPLFRLKRMTDAIAEGRLDLPTYGLRPGDELKDFFAQFSAMIQKLREREEAELTQLSQALSNGQPEPILKELQAAKQARLQPRV